MNSYRRPYLGIFYLLIVCFFVGSILTANYLAGGFDEPRLIFTRPALSSFIITTILFFFIAIQLYYGTLKRSIRKNKHEQDAERISMKVDQFGTDIINSMVSYISSAILFIAIIWYFGLELFSLTFIFLLMLLWIFLRASRIISKYSDRGYLNFLVSCGYGLYYGFLYGSWFYVVFLCVYLLV